ncbi:MAG TPA: aconitate hydratase AcnA [Anaerolineaceae bacterium]
MNKDFFQTRSILKTPHGDYVYYRLDKLAALANGRLDKLPFTVRILIENVLRKHNEIEVTQRDVLNLANWQAVDPDRAAMPFSPGRIVLQDFTGVAVVNDLAAMRSAMARLGAPADLINPNIPVDLVIDHSVQVDYYGTPDALERNTRLEFERNRERYELLHWAQNAIKNFHVVPPSIGIVHQVNIEYLTDVVLAADVDGERVIYPDTLVGTDSHTTMVNGLGVVGWGVGGIEAVAAMLGQPIDMLIPDVIGFKLTGKTREGVTPTDVTLTVTQMLRQKGVVEKFVEFFGPGLSNMPVTDRAMIANMSPENGATVTWFPVDDQTLQYLRMTGHSDELLARVEAYCKEQHLFRTDETPDPEFTDVLELDLSTVEPSLAGPKRPQDRVPLARIKQSFQQALVTPKTMGGYEVSPEDLTRTILVQTGGREARMGHGAVAIAAITSCTNTSNPYVMVGAGLLARKAVEKGLMTPPYVKTSLAPGSRVVTEYLKRAQLLEPLADLGFDLVGYGCTTCIGNSGPLNEEIVEAIQDGSLVAAAVLSGNRNFEGRVNPHTLANYLASPPLVVAFALAGTMNIDLAEEPLGTGKDGQPVYLRDIWPTTQEVIDTINQFITPQMFLDNYNNVREMNEEWNQIEGDEGVLYLWKEESTYLQEPPFFEGLTSEIPPLPQIEGARVLAVLGDSVTTDHISPAGAIPANGAAGKYLRGLGVEPPDFNSFGSRRGNDRIMTRGTFGNIRLKNQLVPGVEGSYTAYLPGGEQMSIYDAAMKYREEGTPLIVLAGKEYGTGSSRDWAAKGVMLLGVKAIIAESYERIHRSNLVGMGVLPLQFLPGEGWKTLGLTGRELFYLDDLADALTPGGEITVRAVRENGSENHFTAIIRINSVMELEYYRHGGILNYILHNLARSNVVLEP